MPPRVLPLQRRIVRVVALLFVLLVGIWIGGHPSVLPSPLRGAFFEQHDEDLVNRVLDMLTTQYYRPLKRGDLVNKSLSAMVASLNDPYSHYFSPTDYAAFMNESNPHLSGIGVDVLLDPHGLRVVDVFPGSPAARAGLARGDVIVQVGRYSLANHSADYGSRLIKGPAGTQVTLTVQHGGHKRVISIKRADIVVPVTAERMITYHGVRVGYLELTSFTEGCSIELRAQLEKALHAHAQALVLDLRENGGGLLDEAVNVASLFIADGTIVSTAGRAQPKQVYTARGGAIAPNLPMVVLVDRGTASAAEIVTGALHDRGRAKVVGTHTYGKGVFQEIEPLPGGGALDITVGEYFTPSGHNLGGGGVREGAGISPDIYALDNPKTTADEALTTAERTVVAEVR
ncbi:MAG TPA: S41 family peptidase [Solirubrobacteraceae bacterium]|nr:S41 family peptidase [Solirubrobacteraceae bacterium]